MREIGVVDLLTTIMNILNSIILYDMILIL